MPTRSSSRLAVSSVLAAYARLAESDPGPLASLLDPAVEWVEYAGARQRRRTIGAREVARLLTESCNSGADPTVVAAAKHGGELWLEFTTAWWRRRGILGRLADLSPASAVQCLSLASQITRVESFSSPYAPG